MESSLLQISLEDTSLDFYHVTSWEFFMPALAVVFLWGLIDSKSLQICWIILSILADHNNAVVWMVFICPLICESSSPFTKTLGIVRAHQLELVSSSPSWSIGFSSLARSRYLFLYFAFFYFYSVVRRDNKVHYSAGSLFFFFFFFFFFFVDYHKVWTGLSDFYNDYYLGLEISLNKSKTFYLLNDILQKFYNVK